MNVDPKLVRKVILFTLGASLGGVTGYFVAGLIVYKINQKKQHLDPMDLVEVQVAKECEELPADGPTKIEKPEVDKFEPAPVSAPAAKKVVKKTDYSRIAKDGKPPLETISSITAAYKSSLAQGTDSATHVETGPRVISGDQYVTDEGFQKDTLNYYELDTTYTDGDDQKVEDPAYLVGNAHLHFGEQNEDPDVVYIRNERIGKDFEVVCKHNYYQVEVLGMEPPVQKKKAKPKARPKVTGEHEETSES